MTFLVGFVVGVLTTIAIPVLLIYFFLTKRTAARPPPPTPPPATKIHLRKKQIGAGYLGRGIGALSTRAETAEWLNVILGRVFSELQFSAELLGSLNSKLSQSLNGPLKPASVGPIHIVEIDVGDSLPIVRNVVVETTNTVQGVDTDLIVDIDYNGGALFKISTEFLFNVPFLGFAALPCEFSLKIVKISGQLCVHFNDDSSVSVAFVKQPVIDFTFSSLFGDANQVALDRLAGIVIALVRTTVHHKMVIPNFVQLPLPGLVTVVVMDEAMPASKVVDDGLRHRRA